MLFLCIIYETVFMRTSLLLIFFCFLLNPGWIGGDKPEFINLENIDYTISNIFGDYSIEFKPPDLNITSCSNCPNITKNKIHCQIRDLVTAKIKMKNERMETLITFNASCELGFSPKDIYQIHGLTTKSGIHNLSLSWVRPSDETIFYDIYIFNETNQIQKHTKSAQVDSLLIQKLNEKTWYQICIASIDGKWRTGRFVCKQMQTDFSVTGPVTDAKAMAESTKILITWSNPQYEYDIPQGYVVHVKGSHNFCHVVTIKMNDMEIPKDEKCLNNRTIFWYSLKTLEISELDPYSEFQVEIIPFNSHKRSEKTILSIKTKEGESDAVEGLKWDTSQLHTGYLQISFNAPIKPHGKIKKYRTKITSTKIDVCGKREAIYYEQNFDRTDGWIRAEVFKQCGLYLIEVTPVNGWDQNGGFGKPASIPYEHFFGNTGAMALNAEFISSNLAKVKVEMPRTDNQCLMNGMVFSIINEKDKTDCMTKIYSKDNCDELTNMVQSSHHCSNMEVLSFNNQLLPMTTFFRVVLRNKRKYKISASRIFHRIEKTTFANVSNGGTTADCFTDCFSPRQFYSGIRSATKKGKICLNWKSTKYETEKSNICSVVDSSGLWCYDENNWDSCSVPECSRIDYGTGCVYPHSIPEHPNSVTATWSSPDQSGSIIGYLTLLHNTDHFCERYDLQLKYNSITEPQLDNSIKGFYLSCKSGQSTKSISFRAHFSDLHQNRIFFLYIIPIISASKAGEIKNLTVHTALAKPDVPNIISIKAESVSEMVLSWEKKQETKKHGAASNYVLKIIKGTAERERTTDKEGITIDHLEMCNEYCFRLASANEAGTSEYTNPICSHTLARKPGNVRLDELKSGYMTNQKVGWYYIGSDGCRRTYRVEYVQKYKGYKYNILANVSSAELMNLMRNAIYVVRVRAEGLMKTINDERIGEYSTESQFYTGNTRLKVYDYKNIPADSYKSLNITWRINEENRGAIFEFMILLKNSSNMCQNLLHLTCDSCDEPKYQIYLTREDKDKRLNLLKCKSVESKTFQSGNISFYHLMTFNKVTSNFSVEIHGTNLMGLQLLHNNSTNIALPETAKGMIAIIITMIILILCFVILILVFIKKRQKAMEVLQSFHGSKGKPNAVVMEHINKTKINANNANPSLDSKGPPMKIDPSKSPPEIRAHRKLTTVVSISEFNQYFQRVSKDGNSELIKEYKKLTAEARSFESSLGFTTEAGKNSANTSKNRFVNILPFDHSRVKLKNKESPFDYVNASYIPFTNDDETIEYIASQGPIDDSLGDFWEMIWEQSINFVIMLTRTMEDNKFKCLQYWPDDLKQSVAYGNQDQFNVTLEEEIEKESHIERELLVENTVTKEQRKMIHLHMTNWFDHAAPNLDLFDKLLFRFHEITATKATNPYLIHCSAGVGRTGTLICIDRIIKELIKGNQVINIYEIVLQLRHYRSFMVQRQAQYIFIHEYINHFLRKYMKMEENEDVLYFNDE